MNLSNENLLIIGSVASFFVALLHIALAIRPSAYRYFDAAELAQLDEQGSPFTVLVTLALVVMFAVWGVYGLSGAGVIRPLPVLRIVLVAIGSIYVLRGLMLFADLFQFLQRRRPVRFVLLSAGSLAAGMLYLAGALAA